MSDQNPEFAMPENVELRIGADGVKRWWLSGRDGWEPVGIDGLRVALLAEHFEVGTTIVLVEPMPDAEKD